jgi:hypothetical protein
MEVATPPLSTDPLQALVSLQTFEGSWVMSSSLLTVLGISRAAADGKAVELPASRDTNENVIATLCVLVFMRKRLAAEKDAWEMIAEKARAWLEIALDGSSISLDDAEKVFEDIL